jgi:hypothetical protein
VQTADLALRSAAVGALLLLGALMLRQSRPRLVGWLGAALALGEQPTRLRILEGESPSAVSCPKRTASIFPAR